MPGVEQVPDGNEGEQQRARRQYGDQQHEPSRHKKCHCGPAMGTCAAPSPFPPADDGVKKRILESSHVRREKLFRSCFLIGLRGRLPGQEQAVRPGLAK
jgi:hypothetical protein